MPLRLSPRQTNPETNTFIRLFTLRQQSYVRFIRVALYPQGIRSYFLRSPLLRSGLRVLDAGCGTGIATFAVREALLARGLTPGSLQGFDLTPAMLGRFTQQLEKRGVRGVEVAQADVLQLDGLPRSWQDFDLIVSASMLEYISPDRLVAALSGLRDLLNRDGRFILFITRRNWLMRPLIGRWWQSNLYNAADLEEAFQRAGFANIAFGAFPPLFRHLSLWGHIVEAWG